MILKKYYLAYGSNLNLHQMSYRCPSAKPIGIVNLENYRLVYKGLADDYAYLTIEKYEGSNVPLGLFEISLWDIYSLDIYEGYPTLYSKCHIPIKIGNKTKKALIYIMHKEFDYHLPNSEYIETCFQGYNDFGFNTSILDQALKDTSNNVKRVRVNKYNPNK